MMQDKVLERTLVLSTASYAGRSVQGQGYDAGQDWPEVGTYAGLVLVSTSLNKVRGSNLLPSSLQGISVMY